MRNKQVYLENWQAEWALQFTAEMQNLQRLLGGNCLQIHHIGSTAVQGLKAKPVIDMLVVVTSFELIRFAAFEEYNLKGDNGMIY